LLCRSFGKTLNGIYHAKIFSGVLEYEPDPCMSVSEVGSFIIIILSRLILELKRSELILQVLFLTHLIAHSIYEESDVTDEKQEPEIADPDEWKKSVL
jgi:hypothetical protein